MELLAAISALNALKEPCEVLLHTDSKYVMDGISSWIHGWKRNGWKTADKKPVKNGELWQALDEANRRHKVKWHWVKGHAGHVENERADELARMGMAPFKPKKSPFGPRRGEMSAKPAEGSCEEPARRLPKSAPCYRRCRSCRSGEAKTSPLHAKLLMGIRAVRGYAPRRIR